jgi:hypothetical protein
VAATLIGAFVGIVPFAAGLATFFDPLLRRKQAGGTDNERQPLRVASLEALPADGTPVQVPVIADLTDAWNREPNQPIGAVYLRREGDKVTCFNAICPHAGCFVGYAADRKVFGQPVGDYQLTQVKLARMAFLIQAARQFAYAVGRLMAKGQGTVEASMVKAYVCKAAEWVTREAMQIHGGYGYAEEYSVSRLYVDARVLSIFEGADETLCLKVIARRLIDQLD